MAYFENSLYNDNVLKMSDEDLDKALTNQFGEEWYKTVPILILQIRVLT